VPWPVAALARDLHRAAVRPLSGPARAASAGNRRLAQALSRAAHRPRLAGAAARRAPARRAGPERALRGGVPRQGRGEVRGLARG